MNTIENSEQLLVIVMVMAPVALTVIVVTFNRIFKDIKNW